LSEKIDLKQVYCVEIWNVLSYCVSNFLSSGYRRGGGAIFMDLKRSGREADHSPPSSAEVKNAWRYTSIPPICVHGVVLT